MYHYDGYVGILLEDWDLRFEIQDFVKLKSKRILISPLTPPLPPIRERRGVRGPKSSFSFLYFPFSLSLFSPFLPTAFSCFPPSP